MSTEWSARQEQTISGWLSNIPGYAGYRDKESRRDADKRVRERIAADLDGLVARIETIARGLADQRRIMEVGRVDTIARDVRYFRDRVSTATYGYGGLFSDRSIDGPVLDQLQFFDESIGASIAQLETKVSAMESFAAAEGDLGSASKEAEAELQGLQRRWDSRAEMAGSGRPASPAQVDDALAVLKSEEERAAESRPNPAYELRPQDAIAVFGENFVVDSRIELIAPDFNARLFRVANAPDRWLMVPASPRATLALLTATSEPYAPVPEPSIGARQFTVARSGTAASETWGPGGSSGARAVTYTLLLGVENPMERACVLDWGSERLVLTGSEAAASDLEIYGATGSRG